MKTRREFLKKSAIAAGMLTSLGGTGQIIAALDSRLNPDSIGKFKRKFLEAANRGLGHL